MVSIVALNRITYLGKSDRALVTLSSTLIMEGSTEASNLEIVRQAKTTTVRTA